MFPLTFPLTFPLCRIVGFVASSVLQIVQSARNQHPVSAGPPLTAIAWNILQPTGCNGAIASPFERLPLGHADKRRELIVEIRTGPLYRLASSWWAMVTHSVKAMCPISGPRRSS